MDPGSIFYGCPYTICLIENGPHRIWIRGPFSMGSIFYIAGREFREIVHLVTSFCNLAVRYRHKVFKNHRIQVGVASWWPVCAKSNMAAEARDLK